MAHLDRMLELKMDGPPYDPRAVANLILDLAKIRDVKITHIALQKLLYFAHGLHLMRYGTALVSEGFEAWKFGPVHPGIYRVFKVAGAQEISFRAEKINVITGMKSSIKPPSDPNSRGIVDIVLKDYGSLSAGRLVEISHAPRAPWAIVVSEARTAIMLGMRIPDSLIAERFKFHKIPVGPERWVGELDEDAPLTRDRSGQIGHDR